ncbi:AbrB family transcriptional regulator [Corynebacterium comes]|uniref:Ammonia monooxygenase n=1 Tax=Corynebacterium comes TaxID=2675218 RepID=A0A6B8VYM9_9CORY|nr:AbrB family transcriptional regulator [Corynebacterium comes]QGU04155.1 Putative ammonia monooxygenase [Corynebacterium comes]
MTSGNRLDLRWMIVIPLSLVMGWGFTELNVPASWILAGILSAGASALISSSEFRVNKMLYSFGAGIVAVLAAVPLFDETLENLLGYILPSLAVALFTIIIGLVTGYLLSRFQKRVSKETGMISMLAGGAAFMPAIAKEIGADIRFVSLTQYLRLLAVAVSLPVVTGLLPREQQQATRVTDSTVDQTWWMIALIVLVALVGGLLAKRGRLPVPSVLGPLLITILLLAVLPVEINMNPPEPLRVIAFLSIGWLCGGTMSRDSLKHFAVQLPAILIFIFMLIVSCALLAFPISRWVGITYFDAYLATSPGAMDTVLAISSETGTSPAVVTIQLIRMILILFAASSIPRIIGLFRKP